MKGCVCLATHAPHLPLPGTRVCAALATSTSPPSPPWRPCAGLALHTSSGGRHTVFALCSLRCIIDCCVMAVTHALSHLRVFRHTRTWRGQNLFQFCQRYGIPPHVRYAVASRKNTGSLVMGVILLDEGRGKRGGGIRSSTKWCSRQSMVSCFFLGLWAKVFFCLFAGVKKF